MNCAGMMWEREIWPLEVLRTKKRVVEAFERVGQVGCRVRGHLVACRAMPPANILGELLRDLQRSGVLEIAKQHVEVVGAKERLLKFGSEFSKQVLLCVLHCARLSLRRRVAHKSGPSVSHGSRVEFDYAMPDEQV